VVAPSGSPLLGRFEGTVTEHDRDSLLRGPANARNAAVLRDLLPWLRPQPLGLATSAGFGDRLGSATPGHIRAVRATGGTVAPIFAQQSIRELERTHRSAQEVVDAAMWGVFAEGWRTGYGADADHLKTTADIDRCLAAGYTFFTFDPGDSVTDLPVTLSPAELRRAFEQLPWDALDDAPTSLVDRYVQSSIRVEDHTIAFDEATIIRAAIKYGRAIAHVGALFRHLAAHAEEGTYEVEISVDETDEPTTHAEHVYIASELRRIGVRWVSLAPRFIGRFEKGVDYIGDRDMFAADFAVHAAIARQLGPYKLSLHSGSDKFSIYDIAAHASRGCVHLKTAGTSYLEALRTLAELDPSLFVDIYRFARDRYETDKASYHISGRLDRAPGPDGMPGSALPEVLDQFDARQILHVTFGSVLTATDERGRSRFAAPLAAVLESHREAYAATLERHFVKHLVPFAAVSKQKDDQS
jgi:hypothetical protein